MASIKTKNEYLDGEQVKCQKCGRQVRVKWFASKQVVVVPIKERAELALRCQFCGFITCDECAHPEDSLFTICPSCQREMGPYYFVSADETVTHESIEGSEAPRTPLSWEESLRMDLPHTGEIVAGEKPPPESKWYQRLPMGWLVLLPVIVGLVIGLIYIIIRLPAMMMPEKTASPTATATLPAADTQIADPEDDLSPHNGQEVTLTGQIDPPANHDACASQARGEVWCLAVLTIPRNHRQIEVWVMQGKPINAVSRGLELLSEDGNPVPKGSLVAVSGSVDCQGAICRLWAAQIKLEAAATPAPPPTPTTTPHPTATPIPLALPTATPAEALPAPTETADQTGCVDALSVTLADEGKELCVQGIVYETTQQGTAFLILFSAEKGAFYFVVYDRIIEEAKPGVCIRARGVIKRLVSSPVIAPKFTDVIEVCP